MLALTACTPARVNAPVSLPDVPGWRHAQTGTTIADSARLSSWWKRFEDPRLNALIAQALAANHDLKIAKARVREARTLITAANSALYPSLDISASGGREKSAERIIGVPGPQGIQLLMPVADAIGAGLAARWEIDVFGGRQLEAEAVSAQADGSLEQARAVRAGLLAQVATHYFELRGAQARLEIAQENAGIQQRRLRMVDALVRAGKASRLDSSRQEIQLHAAKAVPPALTGAIAALVHRLSVLVGEPPRSLEEKLRQGIKKPLVFPEIPGLMPSALLEQRPDLRLAKTELSAAAASLGSARTDLLPKIVLSASGGVSAIGVGGFPSLAETVYTLGSGLSAPLFNAGRIRAHIAGKDARLEQAAANYEKAFLLALEDVENAFFSHRSALERHRQFTQAEAAAELSRRDVDAFYQRGEVNYLPVLDAELGRLGMRDECVKAGTAVSVSIVSLYRALGGGWDNPGTGHSGAIKPD
jgi:NodT family efflux transporter outer membrane factor (OMF) lipoprotein